MPSAPHQLQQTFSVTVGSEPVVIRYRIYNPEPTAKQENALSPIQRTLLRCLYTRHNNGFVRQRRLRQVIESSESWVAPFVVQLAGEYVLDILLTISQGLRDLDSPGTGQRAMYGRFLRDNPAFFHRTSQRIVSYWNCYYRSTYPDIADYPGSKLVASLWAAASDPEDPGP